MTTGYMRVGRFWALIDAWRRLDTKRGAEEEEDLHLLISTLVVGMKNEYAVVHPHLF